MGKDGWEVHFGTDGWEVHFGTDGWEVHFGTDGWKAHFGTRDGMHCLVLCVIRRRLLLLYPLRDGGTKAFLRLLLPSNTKQIPKA